MKPGMNIMSLEADFSSPTIKNTNMEVVRTLEVEVTLMTLNVGS